VATDIFSRDNRIGGVISPDGAKLIFSAGPDVLAGGDPGGTGLTTQGIDLGYQQSFNQVYSLGTNEKFFIAGRSQGQFGAARILGPRPVSIGFYRKYGNICNMPTNDVALMISSGCGAGNTLIGGSGQMSFNLSGVFVNALQFSAQSENNVLNERLQSAFASLDLAGN